MALATFSRAATWTNSRPSGVLRIWQLEVFADLMVVHAVPEHMRASTACTMPGGRWENGDCESFNGRLRDELLNGEAFYTLKEAQVIIEDWRNH